MSARKEETLSPSTLSILKRTLGKAAHTSLESNLGPVVVSSLPSKQHGNTPHGFIVEVQESTSTSTWLEFTGRGHLTFAQWEQRAPEHFVGDVSTQKIQDILAALDARSDDSGPA